MVRLSHGEYGSVSEDVENIHVMQTLVTMGILTEDESLIDAAISEIINLPLDKRQHSDPRGDINYLLIQNQLARVSSEFVFTTHLLTDGIRITLLVQYRLPSEP